MPTITATYLGDLRVKCEHVASITELVTDAPVDNHGKGQSFSPTDLCCTALGTCAMTICAIKAKEIGRDIEGATLEITKTMAANPRCISQIEIIFHIPGTYTESEKLTLENAATSCPVCLTLGAATQQVFKFDWID